MEHHWCSQTHRTPYLDRVITTARHMPSEIELQRYEVEHRRHVVAEHIEPSAVAVLRASDYAVCIEPKLARLMRANRKRHIGHPREVEMKTKVTAPHMSAAEVQPGFRHRYGECLPSQSANARIHTLDVKVSVG